MDKKKEFEVTETTVNAVVPGIIETPWQKEKPEEIKQNIYNKTAIHRFATIDEIVETYRFCIDNPFVNGSLIEANGGYSYKGLTQKPTFRTSNPCQSVF